MPIVISFFPALMSSFVGDHHFHLLLVWMVVPTSAIALFIGCRKHWDTAVLLSGIGGVAALVAVAVWGHDLLSELGEKLGTIAASLAIVYAHWRNHTLCRERGCQH